MLEIHMERSPKEGWGGGLRNGQPRLS